MVLGAAILSVLLWSGVARAYHGFTKVWTVQVVQPGQPVPQNGPPCPAPFTTRINLGTDFTSINGKVVISDGLTNLAPTPVIVTVIVTCAQP